jgi:putative transposase
MPGKVAHVLNRGVDKRVVFLDQRDYQRFLTVLFCVNHVPGGIRPWNMRDVLEKKKLPEREKLVDVLQWTLMPNHFHLLLHERVEGGISEFDRRLTNAYTKYFNIRYAKRGGGYLFQGATKVISFSSEEHFNYIPIYIAMNPLSLTEPEWREKGVSSSRTAIDFIHNYPWSSFAAEANKSEYAFLSDSNVFKDIFEMDHSRIDRTIQDIVQDKQHAMLLATWHVAGDGFSLIALLGIFIF